jgi:hypothetical protein
MNIPGYINAEYCCPAIIITAGSSCSGAYFSVFTIKKITLHLQSQIYQQGCSKMSVVNRIMEHSWLAIYRNKKTVPLCNHRYSIHECYSAMCNRVTDPVLEWQLIQKRNHPQVNCFGGYWCVKLC